MALMNLSEDDYTMVFTASFSWSYTVRRFWFDWNG
jgi:hypothetical protein